MRRQQNIILVLLKMSPNFNNVKNMGEILNSKYRLIVIGALVLLSGCDRRSEVVDTTAKDLEKCESKIQEFNKLVEAKNYFDAATMLSFCGNTFPEKYGKLYDDALIKNYKRDIENKKSHVNTRLSALKLLEKEYPEESKIYEKLKYSLESESMRLEKAERKKQGVSIGMTAEEVVDSMWGKPQSINTSIGSWGTHEQWVYGGRNYLYFENGILKSIQTGN